MAINFGSFLGGLGQGLQSFTEQQRLQRAQELQQAQQERQFQETQTQGLRNFALGVQQARLGQMREQRMEDALIGQQAKTIYDQIAKLASDDRTDEANTLAELSAYGLTPEQQADIIQSRRERHGAVSQQIAELGSLPEVQKRYPKLQGLLTASRIAGEGFVAPSPKLTGQALAAQLGAALKEVEGAAAQDKPDIVARNRARILGMGASPQEVDKILPAYGSILPGQFKPPVSVSIGERGLGIAKEFEAAGQGQILPQYRAMMEGKAQAQVTPEGQRVTGAYTAGRGIEAAVEEPFRAAYVTPEAQDLTRQITRENLKKIRLLTSPQVRAAEYDAELKRLNVILKNKDVQWYDTVKKSEVNKNWASVKKAQGNASSIQSDLKAFTAEMAHTREVMRLELGMAELQRKLSSDETKRVEMFRSRIANLRDAAGKARIAAGSATDKALEQTRRAALAVAEQYEKAAADAERQLKILETGDSRQINDRLLGGELVDPTQFGVEGMRGILAQRMLQGVQEGVGGFRSGVQERQPARAREEGQRPINIDFGNMFGGMMPGAGAGANMAGGGSWWPGGGLFDPTKEPGIDPARILAYQQKYPNVKPETIASYVRGFLQPDGKLPSQQERLLADLNAKGKKPKPEERKPSGEGSTAKPKTSPTSIEPKNRSETGYYPENSNAIYKGPIARDPRYLSGYGGTGGTIGEDLYPYSQQELQRRKSKGIPLGPRLQFFRKPTEPIVTSPGRYVAPSALRGVPQE